MKKTGRSGLDRDGVTGDATPDDSGLVQSEDRQGKQNNHYDYGDDDDDDDENNKNHEHSDDGHHGTGLVVSNDFKHFGNKDTGKVNFFAFRNTNADHNLTLKEQFRCHRCSRRGCPRA